MKKAAACFGGILRPDRSYFLLRERRQPYSLFHFIVVRSFLSKGPDVEVGEGLQLLGRGIARLQPLPGVQLPEQRMNLRIAEFCSGGESRKRRSGRTLFPICLR